MKQFLFRPLILRVSMLVLIFLFSYSASSKWIDAGAFFQVLKQSPLIGQYAFLLVWLVPAIEGVAALLLCFGKTRRMGFYLSAGLLGLFTLYLIFMLRYVPKLPCSCGGLISRLSWRQHLLLNACLIIMTVVAILLDGDRIVGPEEYKTPGWRGLG